VVFKVGDQFIWEVQYYLFGWVKREYCLYGNPVKSLETLLGQHILKSLPLIPSTPPQWGSYLHHMALDCYNLHGHTAKATALLSLMIDQNPLVSDYHETLSVILYNEKRFVEAKDVLLHWHHLEENPLCLTNLSRVYMQLGDTETAEMYKAKGLLSTFSPSKTVEKQEDKQKKEEDRNRRFHMFLQVVELDPDDVYARYTLATLYREKGDHLAALDSLQYIVTGPDTRHTKSYELLGDIFEEMGESAKAHQYWYQAQEYALKQGKTEQVNQLQQKLKKASKDEAFYV
jgi:tetratricopeptide (TPR) repeat protein